MATIYVTYTVYRPNSGEVITEATREPIEAGGSYQAEQVLKARYSGLEVVIRSTS